MKNNKVIQVENTKIKVKSINSQTYICLTDIAKKRIKKNLDLLLLIGLEIETL